ncbi:MULTISPECIES: 2,3-dihydro-2,3-dihydroxybenzoate dehydrogenase [Paenibacillus]|uniref:2,3-dihydro-2,3-dihydroxybenzoate dehydrogenase n=1 Tax=Paenibacillus TaxID=44249 RepID=UPI0022B8E3F9|nr:2,3-dihydro-2,3-dihydroxybenzoate dehydrogenase [Paenibacillus caseinilyticus]MCZ8519583.1 2,3-dihydro-2,3-dihydroxybenzoate dehydrogenase [Paenibacillus caseinilyticus]
MHRDKFRDEFRAGIKNEFRDQVVLVTGAAQGIGAAVVRAFAERGAKVAAVDLQLAALERLAGEWCAEGLAVTAVGADVRSADAAKEAAEHVERELGPIRVLVHAAGILRTGPLDTLSSEDWSDTLAVNIGGVFHMSQAVVSYMKPRRSGVIVTVSSNAAAVPRMNMGAYAASKAAVTMLTKCLGLELAGDGIRCNIVSPGSTDTPMLRSMWTDDEGMQATLHGSLPGYRTGIPLNKLATPEDIACGVLFLASEQAGHLTMHDLRIDGGATLGV